MEPILERVIWPGRRTKWHFSGGPRVLSENSTAAYVDFFPCVRIQNRCSDVCVVLQYTPKRSIKYYLSISDRLLGTYLQGRVEWGANGVWPHAFFQKWPPGPIFSLEIIDPEKFVRKWPQGPEK